MKYPDRRPFKGKSLYAFPKSYTVVDIETNFAFTPKCEILELSAVRCRNGLPESRFSTLIRPSRPIDPFVVRLTGITDEMAARGADIAPSLKAFGDFVGNDILLGYNVHFDVNIIYDNMAKYLGKPLKNDFVDVLRLARKALPRLSDHRQTTVANFFGISVNGAHRAEKDCLICNACYLKLAEILDESRPYGFFDRRG